MRIPHLHIPNSGIRNVSRDTNALVNYKQKTDRIIRIHFTTGTNLQIEHAYKVLAEKKISSTTTTTKMKTKTIYVCIALAHNRIIRNRLCVYRVVIQLYKNTLRF